MRIFGLDDVKAFALAAAALMGAGAPQMACATLGEPEVTVQADVAKAHASIKSSVDRSGYRVHEIALDSGTLMREYVGADGKVFAVTWHGPTRPDLRQALGQYFDAFVAAPRGKLADRRHLQIQQGDLIVQASGHMRALYGRAYLVSAVPSGVDAGDLQ